MKARRLGVVPYLNADPLAAALTEPGALECFREELQVVELVPSSLIGALLAGEVDAALVSTGAVTPEPDLRILPGMGIISRGRVESIELYLKRPVEEVRTVALDGSSRSGVALTRLLFAARWETSPKFITRPPDLVEMLEEADAAILIGNPALQANLHLRNGEWRGPVVERIDLGETWHSLTGLPFVYAVWAIRVDTDPLPLYSILDAARKWGLARRPMLADRGAARLGLPPSVTHHYLHEAIHYDLGESELRGLEEFCRLGMRHGVLPPTAAVRMSRLTVRGDSRDPG